MKKLAAFLLSNVNSTTGLSSFVSAFLGPGSGTSSSAMLAQSFKELAVVADAVNDTAAAAQYRQTAATMSAAINKLLFNPALGIYGIDQTSLQDFSVSGLAFAITSGMY
jgi:neutral trehalase